MNTKNILFKSSSNRRTNLDKAYNSHIINLFEAMDEEKRARWEVYNLIIEVITEATKKDFMNEIKYRITDGDDPNKIMLDIIDRQPDVVDGLIWFLRKKVEEYMDEDFFGRFLG
jgi:hypothetical protein